MFPKLQIYVAVASAWNTSRQPERAKVLLVPFTLKGVRGL